MKLLANLRFMFFLAIAATIMVGCADDDPTGSGKTQTDVSLAAGPDLVTSVTTVSPGGTFAVNLVANAGDAEMNTLEVFEDGVSIDLSRIEYNDDPAVANPVLLTGDSRAAIDVFIDVIAHTEVGTRTYRFTITDADGDTQSVSVDVTVTGEPPVLVINGPAEVQAAASSLNNINLTAVKGTGQLTSISVEVDGQLADLAGLEFDGVPFINNPEDITGANQDGFDMATLTIRTPAESGPHVYVITVTDEFGLSSSAMITYNVGTPLDVTTQVLLLNAAGPVGTGGLDLDTGASTGSSDTEAEIRDLGIDQDLPNDVNWLRQISGVDGADVKYLRPNEGGLNENFTFGSIDSKETLASLVDNGVGFENGLSETVQVGDIFIVQDNGKVYALQVTAITTTPSDNSDSYEFTVVQ